MQTLVSATLDALNTSADPARAAFCAGYHPTASRILGVPTPALRAVARRLARQVADWPADRVRALARDLLDTGVHEGRKVSTELLGAHCAAARSLDRAALEALGTGMDNWVSVGTFATLLAWSRSPDRWWRRATLVSTTGWNQ